MTYYTDKVFSVIDGDTFQREGNVFVSIRLEGVDAPELKQLGGYSARSYLESLIGGRSVRIEHRYSDMWGRSVSQVRRYSDGLDVNHAMIQYLNR